MRTIVTGAAQGLGAAIARRLARDGAAVALLDRTDFAATSSSLGSESFGAVCDVSDERQVNEAVGAPFDHPGGCDLLVNNAGIGGQLTLVIDTEISAAHTCSTSTCWDRSTSPAEWRQR